MFITSTTTSWITGSRIWKYIQTQTIDMSIESVTTEVRIALNVSNIRSYLNSATELISQPIRSEGGSMTHGASSAV